MSHLVAMVDELSFALVLGSLGWFFFVQTPVLMKRMGRDRFVPLQLSLVRPLFRTVLALTTIGAIGAVLSTTAHLALGSAAASWLLSVLLLFVVAPRAMRAGGASLAESLDPEQQKALGRFTVDGGGDSTKVWHRVLGLLTIAVVIVSGAHLVVTRESPEHPHPEPEPANATPPSHADHSHPPAAPAAARVSPRWKANPETTEGVRAMQAIVTRAKSNALTKSEAGSELRMAFQEIFTRCTMTGEAHEALHGFLMPTGALLDELDAASTSEQSAAVLSRLEAKLATYGDTFE
ncbi:MAG: DUF4149 domain-containing protein [Archangiaceae bacterium]|nr:DUF4149 domain-containing protein [Archangiaceae bacterium]